MAAAAPPPPPAELHASILPSCDRVARHAKHVFVNHHSIAQFVASFDLNDFDQRSKESGAPYPISLGSLEDEINLVSCINMLNFGSGYRLELQRAGIRSASECIVAGCVAAAAAGPLQAQRMSDATEAAVAQLWRLPPPLVGLAGQLTRVLQAAGRALLAAGAPHFAAWYARELRPHDPAGCARLVQLLVQLCPLAFADGGLHAPSATQAWLLKKAQLLAAELSRRFATRVPHLNFGDVASLTVFADNVLPVVLRRAQLLQLSSELTVWIDSGRLLPTGEQELELRAVSVHVCELLLQALRTRRPTLTASALDFYFWVRGRDPALGPWPERHYTQDTVFY